MVDEIKNARLGARRGGGLAAEKGAVSLLVDILIFLGILECQVRGMGDGECGRWGRG